MGLAVAVAAPPAQAVTVPVGIDVAAQAGLPGAVMTFGAVVADFDATGTPDILLGRHYQAPAQLFLNNGAGHFDEADRGTFASSDRHNCAAADVNGDGALDAYCAVGAVHGTAVKANELWLQQPGVNFVERAQANRVADPLGRGRRVAFLDANGDGWPDLLLGNEDERPDGMPTYNRLFVNQAGQGFVPAPELGLDGKPGDTISVADVDGDGLADVLLSNSMGTPELYHNDGGLGFTDVAQAMGIAGDTGFNSILADVNADGSPDVVEVSRTLLQVKVQSAGTFQLAYTSALTGGRMAAAGDANGDGVADLYIQQDGGTSNYPDLMLLNDGDATSFTPMSIPETLLGQSQHVYPIDYDANGLTDFLVLNGGEQRQGPIQLIAFFPPGPRSSPSAAPLAGPGTGSGGDQPAAAQTKASVACGAAWSLATVPQPPQHESNVTGLDGVDASDVWLVGHQHAPVGKNIAPLTQHWDGTVWTRIPMPAPPGDGDAGLNALTVISPTNAWAVGFSSPNGSGYGYRPIAANWKGHEWQVAALPNVGSPSSSLTDVAAASADDIWAVGYRFVDLHLTPLVMHLTGNGWALVDAGGTGGGSAVFTSVAAAGPDDVWAAGWSEAGGPPQALLEHWDGTAWSIVSGGDPGAAASALTALTALGPNDVWAVGYLDEATDQTLIEHWDGSTWSIVAGENPGDTFNTLRAVSAASPFDIWAVGTKLDAAADRYDTLAEHWDGTAWHAAPAPSGPKEGQLTAVADVGAAHVWAAGSSHGDLLMDWLCPVQVTDSGFSPNAVVAGQGSSVMWVVPSDAASSHDLADATGLGLFDSGPLEGGGSYAFTPIGAGSYTVADSSTGSLMTLRVPMTADPVSGGLQTTFTLQWASGPPPAGCLFDVQIRRPGETRWSGWAVGTTDSSAVFAPDAGTGAYRFRSRVENPGTGAATGWSATLVLQIR
jgi:hypothetical protein